MSFEPPKEDKPNAIPGYIVVLAAFSVLLLMFVIGIGLVAFGVVDPFANTENEPTPITATQQPDVGVEGQPLQSSGFTVLDEQTVDGNPEITVNVSVTNTSDEDLSNMYMLVQCTDGGNVSNSQLILNIAPDQTLQFELVLYGTGEPECADPTVSFEEN